MSCCGTSGLANDLARSGAQSSARSAGENKHRDDLLASSSSIGDGLIQTDFIVPAMHCIACISSIEGAIAKLEYVERVRVNLSLKRVSVIWHESTGDLLAIDQTLSDLGFEHFPYDLETNVADGQKKIGERLAMSLGVAGFGAANIMLLSVSIWSGADPETTTLFHLLSGLIAVPVVIFSGRPFFASALSALKAGRLNMDVPISLAVLLALAMSIFESLTGGHEAYFDAAVTLLFFLLIGRYLDHLMRAKARDAVLQLNRISSKGALQVLNDGTLQYLPIDQIEPGHILRVVAGERIPVDGVVVKGSSDLDCSLVTGESLAVQASQDTRVDAGTLNLTGSIDVKTLRDAKHSFLAEVSRMMEAAEKGRGRFTRIADRMAKIYAPAVHLLAALAFVGWMIATAGDWHTSIYIAISVLIVTCPCALGLAVPVTHVVAARKLFQQGIIISDGAGFERMEQVTRIIFDKTGTLTTGVPQVTSSSFSDSFSGSFSSQQSKKVAKTLASHSSHPASKAISQFLSDQNTVSLSDISEIPGFGIQAMFKGKIVRLGMASWVNEIANQSGSNSQEGLSFCIEGEPVAGFQLSEILRKDAGIAIKELANAGPKIEIMSGDSAGPVRKVASELGITQFSHNQTPADKIARIAQLHERNEKVLMIGDGLNDAPALAGAHVSIAPSNACDVGRQAADFVFTHQSLRAVPFALKTARQAGSIVRQNFAMALLYNLITVPVAMAGYITPLTAAIAMSASSIVVVANSMRLSAGSIKSGVE